MALFNTDAFQRVAAEAMAEANRQSSPDYVPPPPPTEDQIQRGLDAIQKRALQVGGDAKIDPTVIAIFLAVAVPGVGAYIGEQLVAAGIVTSEVTATAIGTGIASAGAQVAQGVPIEQAIKNAVVSATIGGYAPGVAQEVNQYINNPAVADMIVSAGASAVKTAAAGGSEKDIVNSMTSGMVGSGVASVYKSAGDDYSRATGKVLGAAAAGAVTGGAEGAARSALGEAANQYIAPSFTPSPTTQPAPTPTPVAEVPSDVQGVLTAFEEAAKNDYVNSSTAFAGAGIIPAATAETAALFSRLSATPQGQALLREAASQSSRLRDGLVAAGVVSAAGMTGFIGGQQLVPQAQKDSTTTSSADKIPTTGEDPGTALKARKTFAETDPRRVDTSTQTPSAPAPVKISTQRVAQNLNISTDAAAQLENTNPTLYNLFGDTSTTAGFTPADIETMPLRDRLMLENIASGKVTASGVETPSSEITTPSAAGENVVVGVDSSTGDALIISDSGVVSTVKVDPNTKTGTSVFYDPQARLIINPTTNTITSIDTNITSRVDSPAIKTAIDTATKTQTKTDTSTSTKTSPVDKTKTEEVLFPKTPVTTPVTSPPTTPDPVAPVADTPTKKTPRFSFQTPPSTSPVPETQKDPSLITDPSDTSSTKEKAPSKYKPNINVSTSKTLSKTPDKSSILSEALSTTTGLTAFRGAGEIEGQQTGKPRKNVWNEESLRLKDALGV